MNNMLHIGDKNISNEGMTQIGMDIYENKCAFLFENMYGQSICVSKESKEGVIIIKMFKDKEKIGYIGIRKYVRECTLRIISVDTMDKYIDALRQEYIEWGKIEKRNEIKTILGIE